MHYVKQSDTQQFMPVVEAIIKYSCNATLVYYIYVRTQRKTRLNSFHQLWRATATWPHALSSPIVLHCMDSTYSIASYVYVAIRIVLPTLIAPRSKGNYTYPSANTPEASILRSQQETS